MKSCDVIIAGAGIIGLSLAIELRKSGCSVRVVDKGEPGREASWAAGGMLADFFLETPPALRELAAAPAEHGGTGVSPVPVPTRPVTGQMLSVLLPEPDLVRRVVRTPDVYLIPRSNGHMLIGATLEEAGFDKQTVPDTLQKLRNAAIALVPKLADAHILEVWAGLRPGTPDNLPILGETSIPGYYVATGHFRDGILLAPITAKVVAQLITSQRPQFDLAPFSPQRFQ